MSTSIQCGSHLLRRLARRAAAVPAAALTALCLTAGCATSQPAAPTSQLPPGQPGRIAFANARDGIFNWQADGEKGVWVEAPNRQWYYGKFMAPCINLPFAQRVGFETEPNGDLDKFSYVVVRDAGFPEHCQLTSLVTSNGPPSGKKRKGAAAPAQASANPSGASGAATQ